MFALAWEYLTGRAVARAYHSGPAGALPEWPPHPDRVFQALVAAWGGLGEPEDLARALRWLEGQRPPGLRAPAVGGPCASVPRETPTVFVPVNDTEGASGTREYQKTQLGLLPAFRRRAARTFPSVLVGDLGLPGSADCDGEDEGRAVCALLWREAEADEEIRRAFGRLCAAVTHVGHSRSLVLMRVHDGPDLSPDWIPTESVRADLQLRIPIPGRLDVLCRAYAGGGAQWTRPPAAPYLGYVRCGDDARDGDVPRGVFDAGLIVLRRVAGAVPMLPQTSAFTAALRGTLLSRTGEAGRGMIGGHAPDGSPVDRPHAAFVPLPFVGGDHGDGHLMGFAVVLPRERSGEDEDVVWLALADAAEGETGVFRLVAGSAGDCELLLEERIAPPLALREETWCRRSAEWVTVTPVVLDRLPPRRHADPDAWAEGQIAEACLRQGLPEPEDVRVSGYGALRGVPPSRAFPSLSRKDGIRCWHTHATLVFPRPLAGPLLLGAGRYRGYGFCRPVSSEGGSSWF